MGSKPVLPLFYMLVLSIIPWTRSRSKRGSSTLPPPRNDQAIVPMGQIIGLILGAVVLVLVIFIYADFAEPIMNATENFTLALTGGSTGVALIDNLLPTLAIIVAAVVPLGLIGAVVVAVNRNL